MADRLILGIDVGTTAIKAGLVETRGRIVSSFAESYTTHRHGNGVVEQETDDWVGLIEAAIAQFLAEGHGDDIASVGLCSQVNTHVFVDAAGKPLMPAILWQDGRTSAEAAELDAQVGDCQKHDWWGAPMPIDASHALSRMLWVARNRPDIWEATRWVMLPKDYCLFKLTGEVTTDPVSNVGLVDNQLGYIRELFDLVPGSFDKMAPLVPITGMAGKMRQGAPLAGRPVASGTMDAWAGLVGAGCAKAGATAYLSGTSEILGISSKTVVPTPGAIVFAQSDDIRIHAAPTQSGGDAKLWFATLAGLGLQQMSELVADTQRSSATPLFLPQLEGERAPLWDANLRAVFLGLSRRSGLGDMARAVYEGVALSARHALETVQASADTVSPFVTCAGGGFRSDAWAQIRADVLGVELRTLAAKEPGIAGAATIAAIAVGDFSSFDQADDALLRHDRVFVPSETAHARYNELFAIYKEAIAANSNLTERLSGIGL